MRFHRASAVAFALLSAFLFSSDAQITTAPGLPTTSVQAFGSASARGVARTIWIANRTDGQTGSGTAEDPLNGGNGLSAIWPTVLAAVPGCVQFAYSATAYTTTGFLEATNGCTYIGNGSTIKAAITYFSQRKVTDAVTNGTPTVTSATAAFVAGDVGRPISGGDIPSFSFVGIVNSGTSIGISSSPTSNVAVNATGSHSGQNLNIGLSGEQGMFGESNNYSGSDSHHDVVVTGLTFDCNNDNQTGSNPRVNAIWLRGSHNSILNCSVINWGHRDTVANDEAFIVLIGDDGEVAYNRFTNQATFSGGNGSTISILSMADDHAAQDNINGLRTRIHDNYFGSITGAAQLNMVGINLQQNQYGKVYNNIFTSTDIGNDVYVDTGSTLGVEIFNNRFLSVASGTSAQAINLAQADTLTNTNMSIRGNFFEVGNNGAGVGSYNQTTNADEEVNCVLENNIFRNKTGATTAIAIQLNNWTTSTIRNNDIGSGFASGKSLRLVASDKLQVSGNVLGEQVSLAATVTNTAPLNNVDMNGNPLDGPRWFIRAHSTVMQSNDANEHAIFTTPTNGRLTLPVGTYRFHGVLAWTSMQAINTANLKLKIAGTGSGATTTNYLWTAWGIDGASATAGTATTTWNILTSSPASILTGVANGNLCVTIDGSFECTVAGTIVPTQQVVDAAAAVLSIGSYIEVWKIGATTTTSAGPAD